MEHKQRVPTPYSGGISPFPVQPQHQQIPYRIYSLQAALTKRIVWIPLLVVLLFLQLQLLHCLIISQSDNILRDTYITGLLHNIKALPLGKYTSIRGLRCDFQLVGHTYQSPERQVDQNNDIGPISQILHYFYIHHLYVRVCLSY